MEIKCRYGWKNANILSLSGSGDIIFAFFHTVYIGDLVRSQFQPMKILT